MAASDDREATVASTSLQRRDEVSQGDGASQGTVEHADAHPVPHYNPDAPSEEWGWHGSWRVFAPRGSNFILALGIFMLIMLNWTEHKSHVENFYFSGLALIGILWLAYRIRSGRKMRRAAEEKAERDRRHS